MSDDPQLKITINLNTDGTDLIGEARQKVCEDIATRLDACSRPIFNRVAVNRHNRSVADIEADLRREFAATDVKPTESEFQAWAENIKTDTPTVMIIDPPF